MLSENLQIFRDTYELCAQMYKAMPDVPKHARYGEYGHAVSMSLEALDQIYVANSDLEQRPAALTRYLQLIGGVRSRILLRHLSSYRLRKKMWRSLGSYEHLNLINNKKLKIVGL